MILNLKFTKNQQNLKSKVMCLKNRVLSILFVLIFSLASFGQTNKPEKKMKAYMVSDAHLDTQWNWDIQTTINEYVWNTLSQNLFLLSHYPDYVFNFEGGVKYSWMKEYYPAEYEKLKKYIAEGRWHIAGSSWEASDVLVPSIESAIRNIMLGQTFYRQEFGSEGTDIFLPDCFGFGWTLPSIASHCGLIGFSSQKLGWRHKPFYGNDKYPYTIGLWEGIDGSKIMMAHGYGYGQRWADEDLSESKHLEELAGSNPLKTVYRYYGTGDTGGSPNLASVRSVEKGVNGDGPVEIISATSDQLYKDYLPFAKHPELPEFNGELLMDVHGTGCYTSEAAMKFYNRQNEQLGDAAERASVAADWLGLAAYPGEALTKSWQRFIFHQFHDDLTGTSIPRAYEFSWNDELISLKQFAGVTTSSVNAIAEKMDTRVKGIPVVLYNANAFPVSDIVEITLDMPSAPKGFSVFNEKGEKVESQFIGYDNGKARLLVAASVPSCGYSVYDVRSGNNNSKFNPKPVSVVENSVYRLTLDENGDISSLFDKSSNKELVKEGQTIRLALFTKNQSYAWPAWEILKETIDSDPESIKENVKLTLTENGSLRKTICVEKKYGESSFKQYISLYEGSRADQIDFYNEINWQTSDALLKAEFPLAVQNENATYDLGLGSVKRGNNTETAYEVYAQQWADLTDKSNDYGVSVLNNSKYGWDKPNDNTIRLTLLHTPSTRRGYSYQDHQDFGYHTFTYSLVGHKGGLDEPQTAMKAEILNQPIKAFRSAKHSGELGKTFSFISSGNKNVAIKAVKKAEVSNEYVVRVYEMEGKKTQDAEITFAGEIESAVEADGTEKTIAKATFNGNKLNVSVTPYGIRTYKVRLKSAPLKSLQYAYLPLDFDKKCFSWNEFRHEGNFESGYSYAAELLPDSVLKAGLIPFKLGEKEIANGMSCKGDTILLPEGHKYNRLYLLAASTNEDNTVSFSVGNKQEKITVPYYSGFIGQWGHTGHTDGFLKDGDIAWVGTHRHSTEGDEAYELTYMFKIGLDIPKDASTIILPDNSNVVLFAATLAAEDYPSVVPATELFQTNNVAGSKVALAPKVNLLKQATLIASSGEVNRREAAQFATDGDLQTKWCDTNTAPNFIDFDLGESQKIGGWKLVNAGTESFSYVTSDCFLQGKDNINEEWKTIDVLSGNKKDVVDRQFNPLSVRYIRLLITQPSQGNSKDAARIYELEVY